jgi:predicted O-methyltransferase YrrM
MVKEDRAHRDHGLNPRRWPLGAQEYVSPSNEQIWKPLKRSIMLEPTESKFIQDVPRRLGEGIYANLGHARGGSAILLANGLKEYELDGYVFSVDVTFVKGCDDLMRKYDAYDRIIKCKGGTTEWADKLNRIRRGAPINFVFIDADHCYEAVVEDFNNWSSLVRVGGWASFHDSNQDFSHQAIADSVMKNKNWRERGEDHFHRIRTFERI